MTDRATKRVELYDWLGYTVKDKSIAQAMRDAGITVEELERAHVSYEPERDGDYSIWLEVREP